MADNREDKIDFAGYFDLAKAAGSEDPEKIQDHELLSTLKESQNRYPEYNQINEGGMKNIEAGTDKIIGREVAIARMRSYDNSDDLELFLREGRITACLEHPNIMPVYDIALDEDGLPFFTMKLVRGAVQHRIELCNGLGRHDPRMYQPRRVGPLARCARRVFSLGRLRPGGGGDV